MPDWSALTGQVIDKLAGWVRQGVLLLPNLVLALVVVLMAGWIGRGVERAVRKLVHKVSGNRQISDLLGTLARIATLVTGLFVALSFLELDKTVTSLLAGVGVVGLALGFAFQDIAANFMSGFIMALRRPFQHGDLVEVAERRGRITHVSLRATEIETLDGLSILVPNKDIFQNPIINYTRTETRRLELDVGTAYCDDLEKVREVVLGAVTQVPHRDTSREPQLFFSGFGDSSINSILHIWLIRSDELSYLQARSEAMIAIKKAFDASGVTIPFPIRTLDFGAAVVGGERIDQMALQVTPQQAAE